MKYDKTHIKKAMQLYLVSDRSWLGSRTLKEDILQAIEGGVTCVQVREKELDLKSFIEEAKTIQTLCHEYNIPCIINDNVDVMMAINGDGIHVGQHDRNAQNVREIIGNDKILGVSVQTVEQALKAQQQGADYLGVGAVFTTSTKTDADDVSFESLQAICENVNIPVVAIGGISKDNMLLLKGSQIDGVAVVSAIMAQDNILNATKELYQKTEELLL